MVESAEHVLSCIVVEGKRWFYYEGLWSRYDGVGVVFRGVVWTPANVRGGLVRGLD